MRPLTSADWLYQIPMLVLLGFGLILVLAESFSRGRNRDFLAQITIAGCVLAAVAAVYVGKEVGAGRQFMLSNMLVADRFSSFFIVLFAIATALTALVTPQHQREHGWENGEFYGILMLSTGGMAMIAMGADLVTIFIGIELMSMGVYVLTASRWKSTRGAEAAMKYFLMGAFATGFLVYGIAMIYGATGTTNLANITRFVAANPSSPILIVGIFMVIIAFAFKVAAAPFHMWAPDAYEGAPTPVTGYMAAAVKAAAFVAILRVLSQALGGDVLPVGRMGWAGILAVLAAATMTIGNIAALRQENIKRMLAYSSVSHAGVILVGIVATGLVSVEAAQPAVLFYLAGYTITTIGAFAVVSWVGSRGRERELVDDWNGLASSRPGAALAMTICMLSLGGIPPTVGFFGKFYVFKAAMETADTEMLWLVIVGVLNSAISIFYYLRVVMAMYFKSPEGDFGKARSGALAFVVVVCVLVILQMGVMPGRWLGYAGG